MVIDNTLYIQIDVPNVKKKDLSLCGTSELKKFIIDVLISKSKALSIGHLLTLLGNISWTLRFLEVKRLSKMIRLRSDGRKRQVQL